MSIICTEIAEFASLPNISNEEFLSIIRSLEENFHKKQNGFISTELVKCNEECRWMMIQHWESSGLAIEASKKMMKDTATEAFRKALDAKTVKIKYLERCGYWEV